MDMQRLVGCNCISELPYCKRYIKLHQSTLRKVDVFANLLNRSIHGTLKVQSKWYEIYGISPQGLFEFSKSKWWIQLFLWIFALLAGAWIGTFF